MLTPESIAQALACGKPGCPCGKRAGKGWLTHCPAHGDSRPSLSVGEGGGKLLVKCFAGCAQADVVAALRERGLWPRARW
jgi:putative DNA primase/helicase